LRTITLLCFFPSCAYGLAKRWDFLSPFTQPVLRISITQSKQAAFPDIELCPRHIGQCE